MSLLRRLSLVATALTLLLGYLVAAAALSGPASAAGTLAVTVTGPGTVTDSGEIDPQITCGNGAAACSGFYDDDCGIHACTTHDVALSLTPSAGYSIVTVTGCANANAVTTGTCNVPMSTDKSVGVAFADTTPPSVQLTSPAQGAVVSHTTLLGATASDSSGIVQGVDFYVNGVVRVTDTSPPFGGPIDVDPYSGTVTVGARATDGSGLQSTLSTRTITVDNDGPQVTVTGPDGAVFGPGATQTWTINASDFVTGVQSVVCSVAPSGTTATYATCSGGNTGHAVTEVAGGAYVFSVKATDNASNVSTVTRTFTVDATPPDTSVLSGPGNGSLVNTRSVTYGLGGTEAGSVLACRLYRSGATAPEFAPCTTAASFTASGLDDGSYVFEARATDVAGNTDASPVSRTFTVDATAPTVSIAKQPKRTVKTSKKKVKVAFEFAANDTGATFRCSLDGAAYAACPAAVSLTVKVGKHTLSVTAVDAAGNVSPTPDTISWKVKRVRKHH